MVLPMQLLVLNAAIGDAAAPGASLQGGGLKGVIATVGCCTANHTAALHVFVNDRISALHKNFTTGVPKMRLN